MGNVEDQPDGKLERWFGERLPEVLTDGSEYPLLLTVLGEKPAALTMNIDSEQEKVLEELCDEFDLSMKTGEGRRSKPDRAVGENPVRDQKCAFIARDEERFDLLEASEGRFYGFSDRAVGKFLGFPEDAIEFFVQNEQPGMKSRKFMEKMDDVNRELVDLTTYIVPDSERAVRKAEEKGRKRK
ncbi:MAG: hypothetical protein ABEJ03_03140, partial [Candidatus Nanohaloarchaea archaeon]